MAKIRYNRDGTHSFVGVPRLPFAYLLWCPYCRVIGSGKLDKKQFFQGRAVFRFKCVKCLQLYQVALMPEQLVTDMGALSSDVRMVVKRVVKVGGGTVTFNDRLSGEL